MFSAKNELFLCFAFALRPHFDYHRKDTLSEMFPFCIHGFEIRKGRKKEKKLFSVQIFAFLRVFLSKLHLCLFSGSV